MLINGKLQKHLAHLMYESMENKNTIKKEGRLEELQGKYGKKY